MEKFDVNKHWDDFMNYKVVVSCKTEDLAKEFLSYCYSKGLTWYGKRTNENYWNTYKDKTFYCFSDNNIMYGDLNYHLTYNNSENIVQFEDFNQIPKTPTKENIEVIYHNNETIVLIKGDKKYYRGVSKCNPEDIYNKEYGFLLAYQRARAKELGV